MRTFYKSLIALAFVGLSAGANAQTWDISQTAADHVTATISWTSPNYTLTISGTGAMQDLTSSTRPWESIETYITSLVIEPGITYIGNNAFADMYYLTGEVNIPSSVDLMGDIPFTATGLTAINVDDDNPNYSSQDGALFNKDKTILLQCPGGKSGSYVIPATVTTLAIYSVAYCINLTSLVIPASVSSIGNIAFRYYGGSYIICLNTDPANNITCGFNMFNGVNMANCILYVPIGTVSLYEGAAQWQDFDQILELIPPTVTTLDATDITQTSATLDCDILTGSEPITEDGWYYKKTSEDDSHWVKTLDYNITGLTPNTSYDFFAYASTDAFPLVAGDTLHFTTSTTGVDLVEYAHLMLYPNPVKDRVFIKNGDLSIENVKIVDLSGRIILENPPVCQNNGESVSIDVSSLPDGVYFLKTGNQTGKFIKE